jgi:thiosulfate/3-mercaptopyruvate sulfurtransferase
MFRSMALLASTALVSLANASDQYPRADLLVEPPALAKADSLVVLDARPKKDYDAGHVPNARWVDHSTWARLFGEGGDAGGWAKRIAALGVANDSKVVVYDANQFKDAARIWWILRYWGVKDVRLLNGGWNGWTAAMLPTDSQTPSVMPSNFQPRPRAERLATKGELLQSLDRKSLQIVDARSRKEHCGLDTLTNKRAGAVPGARPLEWSDLIEPKTHRFKPPAELRKLFAEAGVDLDRPTATYCQSGGRAAVMAFGLELMGAKDVSNYYRSWSEWGNVADTPIVKPEPPKSP